MSPAIARLTAQVQDLHARTYPALFKPDVSVMDLEAAVHQHLCDPGQQVLVAVRASAIVGYARLETQERPETAIKLARAQLYIHEFGVDRDARQSGVGTALVAHIRGVARRAGIGRIGVDVFVQNEDARRFYESRGFMTEREVRWLVDGRLGEPDPVL